MIKDKIIVALDTQDKTQLDNWLVELSGVATYVKVGMEAYYTFGQDLIKKVKDHNLKIFLDLKLHDIPNTVGRSCKTLGKLNVDMLNVHAAGGLEMMKAALEGFREESQGPLIAVTQLTSTSQSQLTNELLIDKKLDDVVLSYAKMTKEAGLSGVVCSAKEIEIIKSNIQDCITVTPGIRPHNTSNQDQKRVLTPKEACELGTDYMVIGRPITQSEDIKKAYLNILEQIS